MYAKNIWPLNARTMFRKVVHKCITCFKIKPMACELVMGDLPKDRIVADFPFNSCGVDFLGPFLIRYKNQHKGTYQKLYVCIFVLLENVFILRL